MDRNAVIVITGAAGFIGSCLTGYLNRKGYYNIIIVDNFDDDNKRPNYEEKKICARVDKDELFDWLNRYKIRIDFVFHFGAHAGSDELAAYEKEDFEYSKALWNYSIEKRLPLVFAASHQKDNTDAGTLSDFAHWAQQQAKGTGPVFWAGLRLAEVYGPNEYHKSKMASPVFQLFQQIQSEEKIQPITAVGLEPDLVYVKDVVDVCYWLMQQNANARPIAGIYTVNSGKINSLSLLSTVINKSLGRPVTVDVADLPQPLRSVKEGTGHVPFKKIQEAGYPKEFYTLEEGVNTYVRHFLLDKKYY